MSILTTKRLILRPWKDEDAEELFELAKEPEIGFWCGFKPHKDVEETLYVLKHILEVEETYAICLKNTNQIIGSLGLHFHTDIATKEDECELGYWIGKPFWNQGFATEASLEGMRHAFEDLNISTLWVGRYDGNERSKRVQEKLGFIYHHTSDDVDVPQLGIKRVGHSSYITKEQWLKH